jgi:hypothetical protein
LTEFGFVREASSQMFVKELRPAPVLKEPQPGKRKTTRTPREEKRDKLLSQLYALGKEKFKGRTYNREKVRSS